MYKFILACRFDEKHWCGIFCGGI